MLTRVEAKDGTGKQFVDYRDLAERHLGTIYEGLLEHHLRPIPSEDHWTIDLFNDKGERKVTGSYYTPDFVVEYIVEQTVGPVLHAAVADAPDFIIQQCNAPIGHAEAKDVSLDLGKFIRGGTHDALIP
jgi:hypothetical protein